MKKPKLTSAKSATPAPSNKPAKRTTNAEISAQTRAKVLEATISSLAEVGYAGTTLSGIADRVGLTRPGLFYHFDSKSRLLVEVINAIYDDMAVRYRAGAPEWLSPKERVLALLDVSYKLTNTVEQRALIELLLAARRDPEYRVLVAPTILQRDQRFTEAWHQVIKGLSGGAERLDMLRDLAVSVYRGMTIGHSLNDDVASFDHQHAVLRQLILDAA